MWKRLINIFSIFILMACVSCSSNDGEEITDSHSDSLNRNTIEEKNVSDKEGDNISITPTPAYEGLPEVTVPEISYDEIPYRTFEEFMAQDETDDMPYECSWEMTEDVSDVPKENIILWAVLGSGDYSPSEEAVNNQLRKDGYPFRMKIVTIPDGENYSKNAANSDADIIYTGDTYIDDVYPPSYKVVRGEQGKYLQLDEYLEGSKLWEHCPQIDWDSVEYKGAHYVVPNYALCGEAGMQIRIKKSAYTKEELEGFDGTLDSILPLVSKDRKLFLGLPNFQWLQLEGIQEVALGMYYDENGSIGNVMDLDINIRWMREMNRMLRENIAITKGLAEESADEWTIAITEISDKNRFNEEDYYIYTFKGYSNSFYTGSLAIRSTSKSPEMAFKLMELIITDRTYANLMAYGGTPCVEKDGFMVDSITGEGVESGMRRFYFGIEDNIGRPKNERLSFDSPEDRAEYVEKYIIPIDVRFFEYPALLYQLEIIYGEYTWMLGDVLDEEEFNRMLAEYIAKSRQVFKILEEYQ